MPRGKIIEKDMMATLRTNEPSFIDPGVCYSYASARAQRQADAVAFHVRGDRPSLGPQAEHIINAQAANDELIQEL